MPGNTAELIRCWSCGSHGCRLGCGKGVREADKNTNAKPNQRAFQGRRAWRVSTAVEKKGFSQARGTAPAKGWPWGQAGLAESFGKRVGYDHWPCQLLSPGAACPISRFPGSSLSSSDSELKSQPTSHCLHFTDGDTGLEKIYPRPITHFTNSPPPQSPKPGTGDTEQSNTGTKLEARPKAGSRPLISFFRATPIPHCPRPPYCLFQEDFLASLLGL